MSDPTPPPGAPSEPLAPVATVVAIAAAVLDLAVSFGVHITDAQKASAVALISAAAPLVVWLWGRRTTYSPATVRRMMTRHGPQD